MATYTLQEIEAGAAFLARMAPFLEAGMGFEAAGRAVLDRDQDLFQAAMSEDDLGRGIRAEITRTVYHNLRKAA